MQFDIAKYTGNGGHENGEVASACAIKYFETHRCSEYSKESLLSLVEGAHKAVQALNTEARTTVAACFTSEDMFHYINVGDSRIYYFKNNSLYAQSKDHSVCQAAVDMGTMAYEDIRTSEDRSSLLKVLGNEGELNLKRFYEPIKMEDGDAFLVCSDGFWEFVYEGEMEADLLKAGSADEWLNSMLKRQLLRAKNEDDNYTVICGMISADEKPKKRFSLFGKRKK